MRKLMIVFMGGAFAWLAGLYQSEALMIMVIVLLLICVVMLVLSWYLAGRVSFEIREKERKAVKGSPVPVTLTAANHSIFPIVRMDVLLLCSMQNKGNVKKQKIRGYIPGRGSTKIQTEFICDSCGILTIRAEKARIYDFLGIFGKKKKTDVVCELTVYPPVRIMQIGAEHMAPGMEEEENGISLPGGQPPEIYQIQNYQPGDGLRDIHWKLSAKSGDLLSKQYSQETRAPIYVFWDTGNTEKFNTAQTDIFWEIGISISLGLLAAGLRHEIGCWDSSGKEFRVYTVTGWKDIEGILDELWRRKESFDEGCPDEVCLYEMYRHQESGDIYLSFNMRLEMYLYGKLLMKFSEEDYEEKISKYRFDLV